MPATATIFQTGTDAPLRPAVSSYQEHEMAGIKRITVTLPEDLLREIDRQEKNRSRFVAEAVRRELERRRRVELRLSLDNPHPESVEMDNWLRELPDEDTDALLDSGAGKAVRWVPVRAGWKSGRETGSPQSGERFPISEIVP
jgi:Arc/MetJ-type ribon-helix-helix transcriptional regulator